MFLWHSNRLSIKNESLHVAQLFFPLRLMIQQNRQVTSHREYIPHCEWFKLKLGMHREEGLLTNFPKFHGDHATSTMFSQRCHKTYRTDIVFKNVIKSQ